MMSGRYFLLVVLLLAGCGGAGSGDAGSTDGSSSSSSSSSSSGSGSSSNSSSSSSSGSGTENLPPKISGSPGAALTDAFFEFTPSVVDPEGATLTRSVANLPGWLSFDPDTGRFFGTPSASDEGVYTDIEFTANDGSNAVTARYIIAVAANALEAAIGSGDHRFVSDETVYFNVLYDEIDAGVTGGTLGADEEALKTFLQNLQNDTFSFDLLSACYNKGGWGDSCSDATYKAEFGDTVDWLKNIFDTYDINKYDLFAHADAPRYQKLIVLLADHIRSTVVLPIKVIYPHDFLRALFADHVVHVCREINPAQPGMGNFSRSDFSDVIPATGDVDMTSRKPFRAAGVYALPGRTVEVTRNDASAVTVKIRVNTVRDIAVRQFAVVDKIGQRGYNRPKFVTSVWMEIDPGETLRFTTPYGGPVEVSFDTNDLPVALSFGNVGRHPFWNGPEDTDTFVAALAADEYDWAEFVTPDFEIHTSPYQLSNTIARSWIGSVDGLNTAIVDMYLYYHYALAGYTGGQFESIPEVETFAAANGLELSTVDYVQHVNADQAGCSTACGGNPYDTDSGFDPYSVSINLHEFGHSIQPLLQFDGWGSHTNTDLYGNYTQYRTQSGGGPGVFGCYDRDYQGLFDIVQASRADADPAATMHADITANDPHGLMVFQQLMAMAQNEGTLIDGWNLLPEWQVIEREYFAAVGSDTEWAAKAAGMGFGGMPRSEAASISSDDRLLIILSKVVNRDLSAWLELWGITLTASAKAQVAAQGYVDAPLVYYAMTNAQSCESFAAPSVPVDGVSPWPL